MLNWTADWSNIINATILLFAVLGLASLAGYFCNRVGIVNIAIDGQMIFGALIFCIFAQILQPLSNSSYFLPMILSILASVILSWLFGFLIIRIKCDHVIAGTAINLLLAGLATFLTGPLGSAISSGKYQKLTVNYSFEYQISGSLFGDVFIVLGIVLIVIAILWFIVAKTRFGLRFRAVGDNPNAVDAQGLNVNKYKWIGIIISGCLAAFAGSIYSYAGSSVGAAAEFEGNVGGLGFLALGIVVAGAWKVPLITLSSFLFAFLVKIFDNNQVINLIFGSNDLSGLKYMGKAIPFILSLIALAIFSRKSVAPQAMGLHFDKTAR